MSEDGRPRNDATCRQILRAQDHYDVLGLPRQADESSVKGAFRRKAREVHPDKNASPLAGEAFKRLQKASDVLSDATARRRYDCTGSDEPPQPTFRRQHYHYAQNQRGGPHGHLPLFAAVLPFVAAMLFASLLFLVGGAMFAEQMENQFHSQKQKRRGQPERPAVVQLTRSNADVTCGVTGAKLCVVLVVDPKRGYGERESKLLEKLRVEIGSGVRNSRGQSLPLTWATAPAGPRWVALLPSEATLPWVIVLKPTRAGLRAAGMPLPKAGGKEKGRLSVGVPRLLQDIAFGSAKFEPVKGNVSALFGR